MQYKPLQSTLHTAKPFSLDHCTHVCIGIENYPGSCNGHAAISGYYTEQTLVLSRAVAKQLYGNLTGISFDKTADITMDSNHTLTVSSGTSCMPQCSEMVMTFPFPRYIPSYQCVCITLGYFRNLFPYGELEMSFLKRTSGQLSGFNPLLTRQYVRSIEN